MKYATIKQIEFLVTHCDHASDLARMTPRDESTTMIGLMMAAWKRKKTSGYNAGNKHPQMISG